MGRCDVAREGADSGSRSRIPGPTEQDGQDDQREHRDRDKHQHCSEVGAVHGRRRASQLQSISRGP